MVYCNICEREFTGQDAIRHEKKLSDMPEDIRNKEIVRQLRLWIKEIEDDPELSKTNEASWVINTVDEILHGQYD